MAMRKVSDTGPGGSATVGPVGAVAAAPRFSPQLLHAAASMYYLADATQAEIADRLGTSRPTVSRLLTEARRLGIVRIEVVAPDDLHDTELADQTAAALGLDAVHLASLAGVDLGSSLAPALGNALRAVGLSAGDVLLVSSGRTVYEIGREELPSLPGVLVVPTVGGQEEAEPWYQTNEITRQIAAQISGVPTFLYAPALPGAGLYDMLMNEPSIRRVFDLWQKAKCAVVGVGAPPLLRQSIPEFVPTDAISLRESVGDVCSRFFDRGGREIDFPGLERLVAAPLDCLARVPVSIACAVGQAKAVGIIAGARAGYFNQLVTDGPTAGAILAALNGEGSVAEAGRNAPSAHVAASGSVSPPDRAASLRCRSRVP